MDRTSAARCYSERPLFLLHLPQLINRIRHRDLRASLSHTPITQARSRPQDLRQWWQGAGLVGIAGAGLTLINPRYVEPPNLMSVLAKLPGKVVSLSGFFSSPLNAIGSEEYQPAQCVVDI
jgi:hypothetical protein